MNNERQKEVTPGSITLNFDEMLPYRLENFLTKHVNLFTLNFFADINDKQNDYVLRTKQLRITTPKTKSFLFMLHWGRFQNDWLQRR